MELSDMVIMVVSILAGYATFDGIFNSFPAARNAALLIGQIAVSSINAIIADIVTVIASYILVAVVRTAFDRIMSKGKKEYGK